MSSAPVPAAAIAPVRLRSTLSKAEWNDLERAAELAKRIGGGKVRVGKVSITLPWSSAASKPPVNQSASRTAPQERVATLQTTTEEHSTPSDIRCPQEGNCWCTQAHAATLQMASSARSLDGSHARFRATAAISNLGRGGVQFNRADGI